MIPIYLLIFDSDENSLGFFWTKTERKDEFHVKTVTEPIKYCKSFWSITNMRRWWIFVLKIK